MGTSAPFLGGVLWLVGVNIPDSRKTFEWATLKLPEFWMPLSAFIFGSGSLAQFFLPGSSTNIDVSFLNGPLITVCSVLLVSNLFRNPSVYPAGLCLLASGFHAGR
jgi:hypothetical protein